MSTPTFHGESNRLIWVPTSSGEFAVPSAYRTNNNARFSFSSRLDKKVWESLWSSCLHERHKLLLWKILNNVLPTKDRIKAFVPVIDLCCFLCRFGVESLDHLIFEFPFAVICWMRSPWQIHISHFACRGYVFWIQLLLDKRNLFPLEEVEKQKMLRYASILLEHTWMLRIRFDSVDVYPSGKLSQTRFTG